MDLASFQVSRDAGAETANTSKMAMMMAMSSDMNEGSFMDEEVAALSEDVSIIGVQADDQSVLM
ncbi:hypothetical protein ACT3TQ_15055 [Halomonas sp. AOP12-C2-37]|uniref:hypothetical protein n=1 Tax=unclassified Halomonas TaxID=2609666 RepID=UPI0040336357